MYVIQFVNKTGEAVEQGDVVVIGQTQAPLYHSFDKNIVVPEVDLAQSAYDTHVCGVVCELQTHVKLELLEELNSDAEAAKEAASNTVWPQAFTPQELEKMDRTKVGVGQIGQMVTLGAFAQCKVDADIAPIAVGDLLTTSPTRGHAQKVTELERAVGAIIGKALGALKSGQGKIPVLVLLH
jgi:hypothetical protein